VIQNQERLEMKEIEIDDEVYAFLGAEARPFQDSPNDVLRRLLLGNSSRSAARPAEPPRAIPLKRPRPRIIPKRGPGRLSRLIQEELVSAGDQLTHERKRTGDIFHATVTGDGWIRAEGQDYVAPSPALKAYVGTEIDGWAYWVHDESGKTLRELRSELD
jgi:hypothetical protein